MVRDLDDPYEVPLKDFRKILDAIEKKYGKKSTITFNAGYNNVSCYVKPSKRTKLPLRKKK